MEAIKELIRYIVKGVHNLFIRVKFLLKLPAHKELFSSQSYFTEFSTSRKTPFRIFFEQVINVIKYGTPNQFFFLYGFDIKGFRNKSDYIDQYVFVKRRNAMDKKLMEFPPIPILREKNVFGIIADAYNMNTPHNIGEIYKGEIYLFKEKKKVTFTQENMRNFFAEGHKELFLKRMDGECADGVYHLCLKGNEILYKNNAIDIKEFFNRDDRYLIQEAIPNQHPAISAIHPKAINTLRLVTVHNFKTDEIEVFSCVLRVGRGENSVDNWAAGGLSIGVDTENGTLRKYGFYKPGFGTKATEHPDSHVVFEGYKIPFIDKAIEEAKKFHHHLYGIHSIGWDIAITEEGPCFVEGNDNWEISLMQISNHGLKKEFDRLFY